MDRSSTITGAVIPAFLPLYHEAFTTNYRHFFMWGGRGGAKSQAMSDFFATIGRYESGNYLCTREVQNSMAESVYGSLVASIQALQVPGWHTSDRNIDHESGCHIIFAGLGYKQGSNVKSTRKIVRAWTEEAQQVSQTSLEVLIPTVRSKSSKLYYTFNRTLHRDPIWDYWLSFKTKAQKMRAIMEDGTIVYWVLHRGDDALGIQINYDGNPYFPTVLEDDRQRDLRRAKETGSWEHYNHVWLGQPEASTADSIITIRQAMQASRRQVDPEGAVEIGADIARGGKDRVVFVKRQGMKVIDWVEYQNKDSSETMRITQTAERLMRFAGFDKSVLIKPDDTGLGGGVTDILLDNGYHVAPVNFAQSAVDSDHYANAAAEMWFNFATQVDEAQIPDSIEMIEELTARKEGRRDSKGRRTVEKKDEYMKRAGRSPDLADALLLCFYEPQSVIRDMDYAIA